MDIETAREHVEFCRRDLLAAIVHHRSAASTLDAASARLHAANEVVAVLLLNDKDANG